jgi:hypothetical protein
VLAGADAGPEAVPDAIGARRQFMPVDFMAACIEQAQAHGLRSRRIDGEIDAAGNRPGTERVGSSGLNQ